MMGSGKSSIGSLVAKKLKLSVEDVDALTGTLIGREKSATFRTADVVGLDTMCFVANTAYEKCKNDFLKAMHQIYNKIERF